MSSRIELEEATRRVYEEFARIAPRRLPIRGDQAVPLREVYSVIASQAMTLHQLRELMRWLLGMREGKLIVVALLVLLALPLLELMGCMSRGILILINAIVLTSLILSLAILLWNLLTVD